MFLTVFYLLLLEGLESKTGLYDSNFQEGSQNVEISVRSVSYLKTSGVTKGILGTVAPGAGAADEGRKPVSPKIFYD